MTTNKIVYQNWIVALGYDPQQQRNTRGDFPVFEEFKVHEKKRQEILQAEIERSLKKLPENEREFIQLFYFMGRSYKEIADISGREIYKLEALHRRALKKLKRLLKPFVIEFYGLNEDTFNGPESNGCILCNSKHCEAIDRMIASRNPEDTWRPIIKRLREKFGIEIVTPQILIGHEKYHMIEKGALR